MEILTQGIDLISKLVMAMGGGTAALGAYSFFDGYKSDSSADKDKGIKQLVSGGGIFLVGSTLIPLIKNMM